MKTRFIEEPYLEFGKDEHFCPRAGIAQFDVYDIRYQTRKKEIFVGAIGTSENVDALMTWFEKCAGYIPAKPKNKQPNLYPPFCGFTTDYGFRAKLTYGDEVNRRINNSEVKKILKIKDWNERVLEAVELYYDHARFLAQNRNVDTIVCIIPDDLYEKIAHQTLESVEETIEVKEEPELETNFRRAIKAKCMHLGKPLQLIRELSLTASSSQQDQATKAWNFSTALYYKANQTIPWRLVTNDNKPKACFVGIGFFRSRDKKILHTSLAQIFDELGNGVILRGTPVNSDKDNLRPHLTDEQAYTLLKEALSEYRHAMSNFPARLVVHKSSNFSEAEAEGFQQAIDEFHISTSDFVTILDTNLRFFRNGMYPPLRGTQITLEGNTNLLYTKGSVEYFGTYPAPFVPRPIEVRIFENDESPDIICEEILGLTKMNWNNTQFDGKYPITIACARRVGEIMKYLEEDEKPQIKYSFYM